MRLDRSVRHLQPLKGCRTAPLTAPPLHRAYRVTPITHPSSLA